MRLLSRHLDRPRLKRLLETQASAAEESAAVEHLSSCEACRQELETLAADGFWWTDASQLLRDDSVPNCDASVPQTDLLAALEPSDNPAMLGRLGEYEVLEIVGRGGMGIVLKGYDGELNRYVAIKVLSPCYAGIGAARQRFAREAQAAAAVVHPHVIAIHAVNGQSRLPYLVMPFIAGESLQQRLDREGPLDLEAILRISRQVADGLAAAHAQGLVHRDVKPGNILLERGVDRVLLTDFGLARAADDATLTCSGIVAGTPQYMSPEQARGDAIDHRSDLFSLGSVLYAMCTGCPPFRAESTLAILRRISDDEPRTVTQLNPRLPGWVATLIARLHAKQPADRFASAADVSAVLERCLAHVQNPTVSPLPASLRGNRYGPLGWAAAIVAGVALVAGTAAAVRDWFPDQPTDRSLVAPSAPVTNGASEGDPLVPWVGPVEAELRATEADVEALEQNVEGSM